MAFCPAEVTSFVLAVNFGGGLCESNAPETDWPPAGFEDRKGHQPPMPSASRQGTRERGNQGTMRARKRSLRFLLHWHRTIDQDSSIPDPPRQLDAIEVLQDSQRILAAGAEPIPQGSNRDVALSGNFFGDDALDVLEHVAVEEDSTCDFHHQAFVAERAEDALECRPVSCSLRDFVQPRWGKPALQQRLEDALPGSCRFRIYRWGEA